MKFDLDMISGNFQEDNLKSLVQYIKEQLKLQEAENIIDDVKRMEHLFINKLSEFVKELMPESSNIRSPDLLLFDKIKFESIGKSIALWKPYQIMELSTLLQRRYLDLSFADKLTDEIPFLKALKQELEDFKDEQKPLSLHLIKTELIPKVEMSIKELSSFKERMGVQ